MVFKPNYNQQRSERNRAKEAKKEAKRVDQEEQVARRKREAATGILEPDPAADTTPSGATDAP